MTDMVVFADDTCHLMCAMGHSAKQQDKTRRNVPRECVAGGKCCNDQYKHCPTTTRMGQRLSLGCQGERHVCGPAGCK